MPKMPLDEEMMRNLAKKLKGLQEEEAEEEKPKPKKRTQDERDKTRAQERTLANFSKDRAWAIEENNMEHLVAYRSTNGWWKFGGNSAEFFTYAIAKEIGATANLRHDEDKYRRFGRGVVSIRSIVKIEEMLTMVGYKKNEQLSIPLILTVFDLKHPYTREELTGMRKEAQDEIDTINKQFIHSRPTWQNVDFYTRLRRMIEIINRKSTVLPAFQAQGITQPMMKDLSDLYLDYFKLVSEKKYDAKMFAEVLGRMKEVTDDLAVRVMILAEVKGWGRLVLVDFATHAKEAGVLITKEYERALEEANLGNGNSEAGDKTTKTGTETED